MSETRYECEKIGMEIFDRKDITFVSEVTIPSTPEALFRCFEDPVSWTIWVSAISNVEWTSPKPFGIGTTRAVTLPAGMVGYEEFIAWTPGKQMAFRFNQCSKDYVGSFAENYDVTDLGNNQCKLVWTVAMEQKGIAKLFAPLMKPIMSWYFQRELNKLPEYMAREGEQYAEAEAVAS